MKTKTWRTKQEELLQQSRIVCTTLSMTGQGRFEDLKGQVDVLVIDEACQSNELESLIPF
jgi:superfamily I DNA and/or RNA helicase